MLFAFPLHSLRHFRKSFMIQASICALVFMVFPVRLRVVSHKVQLPNSCGCQAQLGFNSGGIIMSSNPNVGSPGKYNYTDWADRLENQENNVC